MHGRLYHRECRKKIQKGRDREPVMGNLGGQEMNPELLKWLPTIGLIGGAAGLTLNVLGFYVASYLVWLPTNILLAWITPKPVKWLWLYYAAGCVWGMKGLLGG
jgi:hypothetical protein